MKSVGFGAKSANASNLLWHGTIKPDSIRAALRRSSSTTGPRSQNKVLSDAQTFED